MAYTNKVAVAVGAAVLFLAVVMNPRWTEAQTYPKLDRLCVMMIPDILEECFTHDRLKPTEDCCNDLKNATLTQVDCLCDNYLESLSFSDLARTFSAGVLKKCDVSHKFMCQAAKNRGEAKGGRNTTCINSNTSVGGKNKVPASMSAFGLVAILLFVMF
ncbi:Bifunctional inhibitor/plant lipid transfer protein/seed storage helical domain [Arabidopsis suecica]|uniref:Bifunctional inhibitor/plant lipid transfer protein/seed storage helical domain n=1 Tax=Arabidopsis suecica TaxID=45249 RepID=A0A8T1YK05_ARASU|nr:Bifunctional inhibitor/plant lipid transfer protein/seed storage helical domain [Arabidopsis suecica]